MTIKIAIATIFYNNAKELERLLDSIPKGAIDCFIAVDGIFKYVKEKYPELPDLSDNETMQVIRDHIHIHKKFPIIYVQKPNSTEFEKRNTYLDMCGILGDIDVIIIADSDEYFVYDIVGIEPEHSWARFRKNIELAIHKNPHHNVYGIPFIEGDNKDTYKPRIWYKPNEMRYLKGSHYHFANIQTQTKDIELFNSVGSTYCQNAASIIKGGVTLTQDNSLRTDDYLKRREEYQRYLVRFEELTQSGKFTQEECHKMAKETPSSDFKPT